MTVRSEGKIFKLMKGKWVVIREFDYRKECTDTQIQ